MSTAANSVISDAEITDELRAAWAEVSRGYARCWAAMAEVARRTTGGWETAEIAAALTFTALPICERLVPVAPGWTTGQLAARLLREVQAIDPDYTRRTYQRAVRERAVHGYLDHTGTAVLTGSGLPATDAAAAAARLEMLADDLRATGYPATIGQARADLVLASARWHPRRAVLGADPGHHAAPGPHRSCRR
jgi:hypothetical protein